MHELALLTSVVRAVEEACTDGSTVTAVAVRVGTLSGAVLPALEGAWPMAVAGSVIEGARLVLEEVPAAVWCPACAAEVEIDAFYALRCPVCANPTANLVHGREFEVMYVELDVPDHSAPPVDPVSRV